MADKIWDAIVGESEKLFDKLLSSSVKGAASAAQPQLDESIKKAVSQASEEAKGLTNTILFVIAGMFASVLIFISLKRK